ncbi:MAG: ABC transporter ATP-binding protein [Syntrophorhabdales bacterium]|jgi:lipopolysaccharide transport system ATP-binding protein
MPDTAIKVENLSKLYRISAREKKHDTFSAVLASWVKSPITNYRRLHRLTHFNENASAHSLGVAAQPPPFSENTDLIWALNDVSFEVMQGEIVGIIGRNGAGKSTLLKILSHITEPTSGRATIQGRIASLLEVGTGFHPELTGRENIYLNGTILGMTKIEVDKKFDEIVDFAEVEKFIDTPVKHYSSGMYVRLAFAVAAHLEPEILLVDEVLAVGDAAFQKKCLGKMEDVALEGRTVLFVSHNMQAVQSLCMRAFQLETGQVVGDGAPEEVVSNYLRDASGLGSEVIWSEQEGPSNSEVTLTAIRVCSEDGNTTGIFSSNKNLSIELEFTAGTSHSALCVGFDLMTLSGATVLRSYQTDLKEADWPPIRLGKNYWCCTIPAGLLNAGVYCVSPRIGMHNMYWIVKIDSVIRFELILDHGVSPLWNSLGAHNRPGIVAPILQWSVK